MKLKQFSGGSGSLHQFTRKVKNKAGAIVEYPIINGDRSLLIPQFWYWQFTFKIKDGDKFITRCISVKPHQADLVKDAIKNGQSIAEIIALIDS